MRRGICTHDHMVAGSYTHPDGYRAARLYSRPDIRARRRRAGRGPNRPDQTKRPAQTRRPDQADQERGPADEGRRQERGPADEGRRQEADPGPGPGGGQEGHGRHQDGDGGRTEQGNQHQEAPGRPRRCIRGQPRRRHYMLVLCIAPRPSWPMPCASCASSASGLRPLVGVCPFPPWRSGPVGLPSGPVLAGGGALLFSPCLSHPVVVHPLVMPAVHITSPGATPGGYAWRAYHMRW